MKKYTPLPHGIVVADSKIDGQGLFATRAILRGTELGISHYRIEKEEYGISHYRIEKEEYIRTPLGGFINHSDTPNCHRSQVRIKPGMDKWNITTTEGIMPDEELTIKYTLYEPKKK